MPRLRREDTSWVGTVTLSTWAGFQQRGGPYATRSRPTKRPTARIQFQSRDLGEKPLPRPNEEQLAAYEHLRRHESTVTGAVLARIVSFGGADTSFLEWIAEKDGGKRTEPVRNPAPRKAR